MQITCPKNIIHIVFLQLQIIIKDSSTNYLYLARLCLFTDNAIFLGI